MPELDKHLLDLLRRVVEAYLSTAEPVGSQSLVEDGRMEVSSATVRNWFLELERGGYVTQRHTSSGRVPTERGFQTYVDHFVRTKSLSAREQELLHRILMQKDTEQRLKQGTKMLAELSGQAAFLGWNRADTYYTGLSQLFAQPEFGEWQQVISLSEVLDHLDETLHRLRKTVDSSPRILLGKSCPFGPACSCVIARVGTDGVWGMLGPMRMDYSRVLSLLQAAQDLM